MADNIYPSISPDGWVEAPLPKLDSLITDFGYSEFSQSTLYLGAVTSLPHIIKTNQGDPAATSQEIVRKLTAYLLRYYENARIDSQVVPDPTSSSKVGVTLNVTVIDKTGLEISMARLLEYDGSKLKNYIALNNG